MVPGSARNWIAVNAVQQSNLNKRNENKNMTTTPKTLCKFSFLALLLGMLLTGQANGQGQVYETNYTAGTVGEYDATTGATINATLFQDYTIRTAFGQLGDICG